MNRINRPALLGISLALAAGLTLSACNQGEQSNRQGQAEQARAAAQSIRFNANAEIDNIRRRLELTSDPSLLGYIVLFNEAGQPILYEGVRGKVTSGSKRLTEPDRASAMWGAGNNTVVRTAPSDEGTWGSSNPYIFYWNASGQYRQWSGHYLYSTTPIRLRVEPVVVTVAPEQPAGN